MDYNEIIGKILTLFQNTKFVTLASADKEGHVDIRQMCLINDGLTIFMQTDRTFDKIKQITENPNVAINIGAFSFMGTAQILGHPAQNEWFIEQISQKHPDTKLRYTNLPSEVLVKITLTNAKIWGIHGTYDNGDETITRVDFIKKSIKTDAVDRLSAL